MIVCNRTRQPIPLPTGRVLLPGEEITVGHDDWLVMSANRFVDAWIQAGSLRVYPEPEVVKPSGAWKTSRRKAGAQSAAQAIDIAEPVDALDDEKVAGADGIVKSPSPGNYLLGE